MRFASLGGQSNYSQAGKAVADDASTNLRAARRNSPKFGELAQRAMVTKSQENIAAKENETKIKVNDNKLKQKAIVSGSRRKAGVVAAMGKAGMGIADVFMGKEKKADYSSYDAKIKAERDKAASLRAEADGINTEFKPATTAAPANTGGTAASATSTTAAAGSALTGKRKELADAIAGPESGSWGYEAFNQGGAAGGTKVLGKSGSHKETYGTSLSDMTLGQIFHKQNTKQRGMSLDEHYKSGGLHAVGRYQFIGSTLQDEVARMGLSHDTKFTPQVQDDIFFSHIKRVGNISPWVGPSVNYSQGKKDHLNGLISQI